MSTLPTCKHLRVGLCVVLDVGKEDFGWKRQGNPQTPVHPGASPISLTTYCLITNLPNKYQRLVRLAILQK